MQAPLGEPIDIELALGDAAHPADRHEPAADGERFEAGSENIGADVVDDHIDARVADHSRDRGTKPLATGDDPGIQPKSL